jgi:hypothetical protein
MKNFLEFLQLYFLAFESERLPSGADICLLVVDEEEEVTYVRCTPISI